MPALIVAESNRAREFACPPTGDIGSGLIGKIRPSRRPRISRGRASCARLGPIEGPLRHVKARRAAPRSKLYWVSRLLSNDRITPSHKKILIDCSNVPCTFPTCRGTQDMADRKFVRVGCAKCGRPHPVQGDADFDPPRFCAVCSSERRANARKALNIADNLRYSDDERYVLPAGYLSASA